MTNQVVHFEIPAEDMDRARAFYESAFEWQVNVIPGLGYAIVGTTPSNEQGTPTEVGAINGGMLARQGPIQSPVITVDVDDIDAALARIEELGGSVTIGPTPVGEMGFSAYFTDTEGNLMGLWQTAG
jgi:uncharacterized protein